MGRLALTSMPCASSQRRVVRFRLLTARCSAMVSRRRGRCAQGRRAPSPPPRHSDRVDGRQEVEPRAGGQKGGDDAGSARSCEAVVSAVAPVASVAFGSAPSPAAVGPSAAGFCRGVMQRRAAVLVARHARASRAGSRAIKARSSSADRARSPPQIERRPVVSRYSATSSRTWPKQVAQPSTPTA